jgi:uncharacterized protein (DUF1697 family)
MTAYVALLRAVNVGGRKLIMKELKAIADGLGLASARTFIASGNLLFTSDEKESALSRMLEKAIGEHMGVEVPVMIRSAAEMREAAAGNPFPHVPNNFVMAIFLDGAPPADTLEKVTGAVDEKVALGTREIYAAYPSGSGRSKLRIPAAAKGTARNINSVVTIAALLEEME